MRTVVGEFRHLHHVRVSNVYLLDGGRGDRWLVDCGHWSERATLLWELRRAGVWPSELSGLLLTHRHSDHAGNARFLQRYFGVKVYAHRDDADILAERVPRAWMTRKGGAHVARLLAEFENRWPARVDCDYELEDGGSVGSLEVHHVPGHTEGSVFYRHAGTRALLSGDTLLTAVPPLVVRKGMSLPYVTFSSDLQLAIESLRAFHRSDVEYEHLLPGHGRPLVGSAKRTALEFLSTQRIAESTVPVESMA